VPVLSAIATVFADDVSRLNSDRGPGIPPRARCSHLTDTAHAYLEPQ